MRIGKIGIVVSLLSFVSVAASHAAAAPSFDEILSAAKKENHLSVWVSTTNQQKTHSELIEAFKKKYGLDFQWDWLPLHPLQSAARVIAEASAGQGNVDVIGAGSTDQMGKIAEKGLLKPYPWVQVFGTALPTIGEPYGRVLAEFRGMGLLWFDNVYGVAWNTKLTKAQDVPTGIDEFADPKWKGRFAFNAQSGTPLDIMALAIGEEAALNLGRKIAANRPVLANGTPMLSTIITSGQARLGVSSFFNADRAKKMGEPQEFRFFDDYAAVNSLNIYVPENAPHPNLARLFAAWLATAGAPIAEADESLGRISDPNSGVAKAYAAQAVKGQLLEAHSAAEVDAVRTTANKLTRLFTSEPGP